jgi:hypothetical protein
MNYIEIISKKTNFIPQLSNGEYDFSNIKNKFPKKINLLNINKIKKKLNKKFYKFKKLLCLDFHGVSDLYDTPIFEKIPSTLPKCIISYVGKNKNTLGSTINSILKRIKMDEVKLGIIVHTKNIMPIEGTKGWIINLINEILPNLEIYFIDDSIVNIKCVSKIKNNKIHVYFINNKNKPKNKINRILKNII